MIGCCFVVDGELGCSVFADDGLLMVEELGWSLVVKTHGERIMGVCVECVDKKERQLVLAGED